jgi:hypothetical protein
VIESHVEKVTVHMFEQFHEQTAAKRERLRSFIAAEYSHRIRRSKRSRASFERILSNVITEAKIKFHEDLKVVPMTEKQRNAYRKRWQTWLARQERRDVKREALKAKSA